MIEFRGIGKRYGDRPGRRRIDALQDVSLRIERGETVAVLGPNGAGKSTLLGIALGFLHPSAGTVSIDGMSPRRYRRKRGAAWLPERFTLPAAWPVLEALTALARLEGPSAALTPRAASDTREPGTEPRASAEHTRGSVAAVGQAADTRSREADERGNAADARDPRADPRELAPGEQAPGEQTPAGRAAGEQAAGEHAPSERAAGEHTGRSYPRERWPHARVGGADARERARAALERFGLAAHAGRAIGSLSRGLLQRVGLAQTMLAAHAVAVLDEPTEGLDPAGRLLFREMAAELRAAGTTLIVASHDLPELDRIADRAILLHAGRVREVFALEAPAARMSWILRLAAPHPSLTQLFPDARRLDVDTHWSVTCDNARDLSHRLAALVAAGAIIVEVISSAPTLEERVREALGAPQSSGRKDA